jgi:hypothetical protein
VERFRHRDPLPLRAPGRSDRETVDAGLHGPDPEVHLAKAAIRIEDPDPGGLDDHPLASQELDGPKVRLARRVHADHGPLPHPETAKAQPVIEPFQDGVRVLFLVKEGGRMYVRKIVFQGKDITRLSASTIPFIEKVKSPRYPK